MEDQLPQMHTAADRSKEKDNVHLIQARVAKRGRAKGALSPEPKGSEDPFRFQLAIICLLCIYKHPAPPIHDYNTLATDKYSYQWQLLKQGLDWDWTGLELV